MIRPQVRSQIRPPILPQRHKLSEAISRYFTDLDASAAKYYELSSPVPLIGDFEIPLNIATTDTTSYRRLIGFESPNGGSRIYLSGTGELVARIDGDPVVFCTPGVFVADGKLRTVVFSRVGNDYTLSIDGVGNTKTSLNGITGCQYIGSDSEYPGSQTWDGIIANMQMWVSGDSNTGELFADFPFDGYLSQPYIFSKTGAFGDDILVNHNLLVAGDVRNILPVGSHNRIVRIQGAAGIAWHDNVSVVSITSNDIYVSPRSGGSGVLNLYNNSGADFDMSGVVVTEFDSAWITAYNTTDSDSTSYTKANQDWISENLAYETTTEILGDDLSVEYSVVGEAIGGYSYLASATIDYETGAADVGFGGGNGIPSAAPWRIPAPNVGDVVGGAYIATQDSNIRLFGRDSQHVAYGNISVKRLLEVAQ